MKNEVFELEWLRFAQRLGEAQAQAIWIQKGEISERDLFEGLSEQQKKVCARLSHPNRQLQWALARWGERQIGADLKGPVLLSTTHTEEIVFVVGLTPKKTIVLGVGVDLEKSDRAMSQRVAQRLIHPEEGIWTDLRPLDFWVIKEACFKANPRNQGTTLGQYRIKDWDPGTCTGKVSLLVSADETSSIEPHASVDLLFSLSQIGEWTLAFSVARAMESGYK